MLYMDENFDLFKSGDIRIKDKKNLIELDELIAPAVSLFNLKGYKTDYCCSGHIVETKLQGSTSCWNNPYIIFKEDYIDLLINKHKQMENDIFVHNKDFLKLIHFRDNPYSNRTLMYIDWSEYRNTNLFLLYELQLKSNKAILDFAKYITSNPITNKSKKEI